MPAVADILRKRLAWDDLDPAYLRRLIEAARDEDLAGLGLRQDKKPRVTGDRSTASLAAAPRQGSADLVAREPLTTCGLPLIPLILSAYGGKASARLRARDGRALKKGDVLATLHGDPRTLLAAERVILNFLQRLSGIATQTRRYADALGPGRTRLLDIRKTTPGWRMLEKYAVARGGGWNHRLGLFDRVMLKDNHLALLGVASSEIPNPKSQILKKRLSGPGSSTLDSGLSALDSRLASAVARAKKAAPDLPVEVEVDRLDQIPAVLAAGADVILLDNFTPAQIKRAVALIGGRAFTEASGGITLKTLPRFAGLGLDFVSTGALIHQSVWVDIGMDWRA